MNNTHNPIEGTNEAWDNRTLGASLEHAQVAPAHLQAEVDAALGLQAISIRLPKQLIDAYKLIAAHHGVGYQPLMRDILQRYAPLGLREVLQHHEAKAGQVDIQMDELKKVA